MHIILSFLQIPVLLCLAEALLRIPDQKTIDRYGPDGISRLIKNISYRVSKFQTGYLFDYAFVMLIGFSLLLTFLIIK